MQIAITDKILKNSSESSTVRLHRIIRFWLINISWVRKIEVDAVCDGKDILIPGIMEHIERAGIIPETVFPYIRHRLSARRSKVLLLSTRSRLQKHCM